MSLTNMALSSNERREQNIIRLRQAFNKRQVVTVKSAMQWCGYSRTTILRWAKDGNIPLIDDKSGKTVVAMTSQNKPRWLA